jgi:hypothetical protein
MAKAPKGGRVFSVKEDDALDKKQGIKPGSAKDKALDKQRGVKEPRGR